MIATLTAPSPVTPGSRIKVVGKDFPADKVYLTLDGQGKTTNVFGAPTFEVWINVSTQVRVQTLIAYLRSTNQELARTTINVQKTVPPDPTPVPTPTPGVKPSYLPTPPNSPPAFGSSIVEGGIKVTGVSAALHAYSTIEPWSKTGKYLLLGYSPGSAELRDGNAPYGLIKTLSVPSYALWSPTEEDCLYGVPRDPATGNPGNLLVKFNVITGQTTVLKDFGHPVSIGNFEGGISDDGRYLALTANGRLIVWDVISNSEFASIAQPANMDKFQISRKGNYVVVVFDDSAPTNHTYVYDRNLTNPRQLWSSNNHGDNALLDGEEAFVSNNVGRIVNGALKSTGCEAIRLSDLKITTLVPYRNGWADGHTSGRGPKPVFSNYKPEIGLVGSDQVVAANADGTVDLFGWAHRIGTDYRGEPHAVPDRTGKRIIWVGWGGVGSFISEAA